MGFFESFASYLVSDANAEEQQSDVDTQEEEDGADVKAQDAEEGEGGDSEEEEDEDEDEDEEEEEEPEDPMPALQEECAQSSCKHTKHEYDDCVTRVQSWEDADESERKGPKEDCTEEFFEYTHCVTQCAAPKLWKELR